MDLSSLIHFLTDKSRNISSKAIFVIVALILLFVLDDTFSFSYFYNNSQKVSLLKEINSGLNDLSLTEVEKSKLLNLRKEIINHRTFKDITTDYLTNLEFEASDENPKETEKKSDIRNPTIHLITSSWWLILPVIFLVVALPFVLIIERKDILNTTLGFILVCGVGFIISLFFSKAFSYIPLIKGDPLYNYILNFILSSSLLCIIIIWFKKSMKNSNS